MAKREPKDIQIVYPLDVSTGDEARRNLDDVASVVDVIKVGHEFMWSIGNHQAIRLAKEYGKKIFADGKIIDIPNSTKGGVSGIFKLGVEYYNMMALGGRKMMADAVAEIKKTAKEKSLPCPKSIAVTILTSQTFADLMEMGFVLPPGFEAEFYKNKPEGKPEDLQQAFITSIVMKLATIAVGAGVDIILSSPLEAQAIHEKWPEIEIFTPGIRLRGSPKDDQSRKLAPGEAVLLGVTGLVIGRPIREPEGGKTRLQVVEEIREDIDKALA